MPLRRRILPVVVVVVWVVVAPPAVIHSLPCVPTIPLTLWQKALTLLKGWRKIIAL